MINEIVRKMIDEEINEIHTTLPAKIESVDLEEMRAEVTLLNKKELEDEQVTIPPIVEVPISYYRAGKMIMRPPYEKGDTVIVAFSERGIDRLMITGDPEETEVERMHSYDDAVIVGGLQMEQHADLPTDYTDNMLIGLYDEGILESWIRINPTTKEIEIKIDKETWLHIEKGQAELKLEGDAYVKIEKGVATVEADTVNLGAGANEAVALGDSLKEWLDAHSHPSDGSPPTSPSPDPSGKVMTE